MTTGGRSRSFLPTLPDVPMGVPSELRGWLRDLKLQLEKFFNDARLFIPDFRLFGRVNRIPLLDLFILEPTEMFMEVFSNTGGAVSSNATNAIREGKLGQILIIENIGVQLVTIKNNAKTKFAGAADAVLGQYDTVVIRWDGENDQWVQWAGSNN